MADNVCQFDKKLYQAQQYAARSIHGEWVASGTLCGHIDFVIPGYGTLVLDPVEARAVAQMILSSCVDVLANSDPNNDPRLC